MVIICLWLQTKLGINSSFLHGIYRKKILEKYRDEKKIRKSKKKHKICLQIISATKVYKNLGKAYAINKVSRLISVPKFYLLCIKILYASILLFFNFELKHYYKIPEPPPQ